MVCPVCKRDDEAVTARVFRLKTKVDLLLAASCQAVLYFLESSRRVTGPLLIRCTFMLAAN